MNNNNNVKFDDINFNKKLEQFIKGETKIKYYLREDEPKYFKLKSNSNLMEIDRIFTNPNLFYFSILFYFNKDFLKMNTNKLIINNVTFDASFNNLIDKNLPNEKFANFDFLKSDGDDDNNDNINEVKKKEFIKFLKQISSKKKINMNYSKKYVNNNDNDRNDNDSDSNNDSGSDNDSDSVSDNDNDNDNNNDNDNDIEENINFYFKSEKEKKEITNLNFFIKWISEQIYAYLINYIEKNNKELEVYKKKKNDIINIINDYFKLNDKDFKNKLQKFDKYMPSIFLNLKTNINNVINGYINGIIFDNLNNTIAFINYFGDLDYLNINGNKKIIKNIKYSIFGSKIKKTDSRVVSGYHIKNIDIGFENSVLFNLIRKYMVFENTKYVSRNITVNYYNISNENKLEHMVNDFNSGENNKLFYYINKLNDIFIKQFVDFYQSKKLKLIIKNNLELNDDNSTHITKLNIVDWIKENYPNIFGINFTMLKCVEFNKLLNVFCTKNNIQYKCKSKFPLKIKNYSFANNNNNNNIVDILNNKINNTNIDNFKKVVEIYEINLNNLKRKLENYEEKNKKRKINNNGNSDTSNENEQ